MDLFLNENGMLMFIKALLKSIKPFRLATLFASYAIGAGLVQYVRSLRSWGALIQGFLFLVFIVLSVELLQAIRNLQNPDNWPVDASINEVKRTRWLLALVAATFLTIGVTLVVGWIQAGILWQGLFFLVFGFFLMAGIYFLGEMRESLRPFMILIETLIFVVIPPAIAYFIQSQEPHPFLTLVILGLIPAYVAYRLLIQLKSYQYDQSHEILTFVTYAGWEKAMVAHNGLILSVFLIFALISILGFPWFLLWPVFLVSPIGIVEIWLIERVRRGAKPLWGLMQFATACVFFIPIYLLGFAFWIR
jgi:1,4-dihydroxy-2-naphthoate octaprenyltransferase